MAYDTTEAVAKFLSGFQMKITKRERDTVAPDYYVKYLLTLSKGGKDFSTTFVSDPRAFGEPTVTQVFSALFVSRYYMTDLLEDNSIAVSLDTMLKNGNPFSLDGGIPAWTVEGDDLAKVNDFLKKSCMEFCGSLPGDDKGEDGYSLTGEARDAATSRNELNENRKSVAEMIQECFDSIENNGDAI